MVRDVKAARPDPDALLAELAREKRGRLKIFLGMAPGVGKTYEMLTEAQRKSGEGRSAVVGVVETHGRPETEALLSGLEVLPRTPIQYRGRTMMEFDLDAALQRRPEILLVDEYAHSNAPSSRHPKRWQDVQELLAAGINVWTTVNVQHIDSLVDVVWKITGVRVQETIPDLAFSTADEIQLIDITPAELRERLADGKVYVPETARLAATNFFKAENLTALRELALRRAAQMVDDHLVDEMQRRGIEGPWAAGERILVLIGADGAAQALVRSGRRLSDLMMGAPWTVATVEGVEQPVRDLSGTQHLRAALKLTVQLGGSGVTLQGPDLPQAVLDYAKRNNVTQIVLGKTRMSWWKELRRRSLARELLNRSGGAAVHFVTLEEQDKAPGVKPQPVRTARGGVTKYLLATLLVGGSDAAATLLDRFVSGADLAIVFLCGVLVTGLALGLRPALFASALAIGLYNFFFIEPRFTFTIGHPADLLTFLVFIAVAVSTGSLAGRVRDQGRLAVDRASAVALLLAASRRLSATLALPDAARALAEQVSAATGGDCVVLLASDDELTVASGAPAPPDLATGAMTAARWAWSHGEASGAGTGTLPQVDWTFYPLQGLRRRVGALGVSRSVDPDPGRERLAQALMDQGAVALERAELATASVEAAALRKSDRFRSALLNSISHDLRTPLSTILGVAETLMDYGENVGVKDRRELLASVREEAERLNRYVANLLNMTRLEGGALSPSAHNADVREIINLAVERVTRRLGARKIRRDFPRQLSLVKADEALLEQALANILENAVAYSPDGTTIEVAAYEDRANVVISIEDEGPGVPTDQLEAIFEKFRRLTDRPSDRNRTGVGLGLAISKGFIEAMGGRIAAASPIHGDHGTRMLISLPKAAPTPRLLMS